MTDTVQVPREATEFLENITDEQWEFIVHHRPDLIRRLLATAKTERAAAPQATDPRDAEIERLTRERDEAQELCSYLGKAEYELLHDYQHSDRVHLVKPRLGGSIIAWAADELKALSAALTTQPSKTETRDDEIVARAICKDRNNNSDSAWVAYQGEARIAIAALSSAGRLVGAPDATDDGCPKPPPGYQQTWAACSAPVENGVCSACGRANPAPDATFCGADPFENGYTPAAVEKMYRDRLTAAQAENEKLRAACVEVRASLSEYGEAYTSMMIDHCKRTLDDVLSPPPLSPEKE